jgi:hypothetical protein
MSELEDFIGKNRDAFDVSEPESGHAERFALRLERIRNEDQKPRELFWRIAAAAMVLVVIGLSVWLPKEPMPTEVQYGSLSLGEVSQEFAKVEAYYTTKIESGSKEIHQIARNNKEALAYMEELERLKLNYQELEKELYSSGGHEKVITAMIENFRLRLALIEKMESKNNAIHSKETP